VCGWRPLLAAPGGTIRFYPPPHPGSPWAYHEAPLFPRLLPSPPAAFERGLPPFAPCPPSASFLVLLLLLVCLRLCVVSLQRYAAYKRLHSSRMNTNVVRAFNSKTAGHSVDTHQRKRPSRSLFASVLNGVATGTELLHRRHMLPIMRGAASERQVQCSITCGMRASPALCSASALVRTGT